MCDMWDGGRAGVKGVWEGWSERWGRSWGSQSIPPPASPPYPPPLHPSSFPSSAALTFGFITEFVIKHIGLGFIRYWSSAWNALDGIIVLISVAELILTVVLASSSIGGLQVGGGCVMTWDSS